MFSRWPKRNTTALVAAPPGLHFAIPDGTYEDRLEGIVDALVETVDPVTRARLGADPHDAIGAVMEDPDGYPPGWQKSVADAVNTVIAEAFPRVVADDADVEHGTYVAVAALAAVVAAGLPADTARVADVTRTVLVSMQQEVAG